MWYGRKALLELVEKTYSFPIINSVTRTSTLTSAWTLIFQMQCPWEMEEADESKSCVIINLCFSERQGKGARRQIAQWRRIKNAWLGFWEEPPVLAARALYLAKMEKKTPLWRVLYNHLIYGSRQVAHTNILCTHRSSNSTQQLPHQLNIINMIP